MTDYRASLSDFEEIDGEKLAVKKYSNHIDAYGGIFNSISRQKLLGKNPNNDFVFTDTPRFWSDIRKTVKNGLIDIQLVCEIANSNQIKKMFQHTLDYPNQGKGVEISKEESLTVSTNLTSIIESVLINTNNDLKNDLWSAEFAKRIITVCLNFIIQNDFVDSPLHKEHLRLVNVILDSELRHYR